MTVGIKFIYADLLIHLLLLTLFLCFDCAFSFLSKRVTNTDIDPTAITAPKGIISALNANAVNKITDITVKTIFLSIIIQAPLFKI